MTNHLNLVDVEAKLIRHTDDEILIDDGMKRVWLPKVKVQDNEDGTYTMPHWLSLKQGVKNA